MQLGLRSTWLVETGTGKIIVMVDIYSLNYLVRNEVECDFTLSKYEGLPIF